MSTRGSQLNRGGQPRRGGQPSRGGQSNRGGQSSAGVSGGVVGAAGARSGGTVATGQVSPPVRRVTRSTSQISASSESDAIADPSQGTLCGLCSSTTDFVGEDGIGCDYCPSWFHPTSQCTGLDVHAIRCIQGDGGNAIRYCCTTCRCTNPPPKSNSGFGVSGSAVPDSATISQLFLVVKSLAESVASLTGQFQRTQQGNVTMGASSQNITGVQRESLYTEFWEFEQRKKRRGSIFVKGLVTDTEASFRTSFSSLSQEITGQPIVPEGSTASMNSVVC